jgi:LacI family transcriptional regulator
MKAAAMKEEIGMITIKDVAEQAGVSYATVSRALNGRDEVSPSTRARIIAIAQEMGYQPNAVARSLVSQKTSTIALIVPDVANSFFADITMAVHTAAEAGGYTTMVCNTSWNPAKEQEKLQIMVQQRVEGIILKPTAFIRPGSLEALGVPLVLFWHAMDDDLSYIEVDHALGSRLAIEHLLERGYKRIAYLGGVETSPSNQIRLLAYQKCLQEAGLPVDPKLISYGPFRLESGYQRLADLMKLEKRPDAIFCGSDIIAMGALQYARRNNIQVPGDLGIVGFDDVACASLPLIGLTTIEQPRDQLGEAALDALLTEIKQFPQRARQRVMIKPKLKIRSTT